MNTKQKTKTKTKTKPFRFTRNTLDRFEEWFNYFILSVLFVILKN